MSFQPILPAFSMVELTSRIATGTAEMYSRPKYPHYCLIGMALASSQTGQMQVGEIYKYIETNFWYCVSSAPKTWKNSVRHCLSSSGYFEKCTPWTSPIDCAKKGNQWRIKPQSLTNLLNKIQMYGNKQNKTHKQVSPLTFINSTVSNLNPFENLLSSGTTSTPSNLDPSVHITQGTMPSTTVAPHTQNLYQCGAALISTAQSPSISAMAPAPPTFDSSMETAPPTLDSSMVPAPVNYNPSIFLTQATPIALDQPDSVSDIDISSLLETLEADSAPTCTDFVSPAPLMQPTATPPVQNNNMTVCDLTEEQLVDEIHKIFEEMDEFTESSKPEAATATTTESPPNQELVSKPVAQSSSCSTSTDFTTNEICPLFQLADEQLPDNVAKLIDEIHPVVDNGECSPQPDQISNDAVTTQEKPKNENKEIGNEAVSPQEINCQVLCQGDSFISNMLDTSIFTDITLEDLEKETLQILDELPVGDYLPVSLGLHAKQNLKNRSCEGTENVPTDSSEDPGHIEENSSSKDFAQEQRIEIGQDKVDCNELQANDHHNYKLDLTIIPHEQSKCSLLECHNENGKLKQSDCDQIAAVDHENYSPLLSVDHDNGEISFEGDVASPKERRSPKDHALKNNSNACKWITKRFQTMKRLSNVKPRSHFHMYKLGRQQTPDGQNEGPNESDIESLHTTLGRKRQLESIPTDLDAPLTKRSKAMDAIPTLMTDFQLHTGKKQVESNRNPSNELPQTILGKKRASPEADIESPQAKKTRSIISAATNLRAAMQQATRNIRKKCKKTIPILTSSTKPSPTITNISDLTVMERKHSDTDDSSNTLEETKQTLTVITDFSSTEMQVNIENTSDFIAPTKMQTFMNIDDTSDYDDEAETKYQEFSVTNISPTHIIIRKTPSMYTFA